MFYLAGAFMDDYISHLSHITNRAFDWTLPFLKTNTLRILFFPNLTFWPIAQILLKWSLITQKGKKYTFLSQSSNPLHPNIYM